MAAISDSDLLLQELRPLLLSPGARDLIRDEAIEQNCRRDMDTVLPTELDCNALFRRWQVRAKMQTYSCTSGHP